MSWCDQGSPAYLWLIVGQDGGRVTYELCESREFAIERLRLYPKGYVVKKFKLVEVEEDANG